MLLSFPVLPSLSDTQSLPLGLGGNAFCRVTRMPCMTYFGRQQLLGSCQAEEEQLCSTGQAKY